MRKKRKKEIEHNNAHILANTIRKQNDKTKCQEKKPTKKIPTLAEEERRKRESTEGRCESSTTLFF